MNKIKMGKFIKKLRDEANMSQKNLADKLGEVYLEVSSKAISDWEHGKTIPDIDKLVELGNIFDVTVDELLDGERIMSVDFADKYFYKKGLSVVALNDIIKVIDNFNKLIDKRVAGELSFNDEREFRYLFENFYHLSDYCKEVYESSLNDPYLKFKEAIKKCLPQIENMSDEEKAWEIKKYVYPSKQISFNISAISNNVPEKDSYWDTRYKNLEFWEKDMILMFFQIYDYISIDETRYGSKNLEKYEERTGHEFNKEQITKDIIKYLVDNGARINRQYINFTLISKEQHRIIDRLEELYHLCKEPLHGQIYIDEEVRDYSVDNTPKNRFIHELYYYLSDKFDYDLDELYELVMNNDDFTREMLINAAEKRGINIDREDKYIFSDLNVHIESAHNEFLKFKSNEKLIAEGLIEYEKLLLLLKKGEKMYSVDSKEFVGGNTPEELIDWCYYRNQLVTKEELYNLRKNDETRQMLNDLNTLSVEQLREKYFAKEVHYSE